MPCGFAAEINLVDFVARGQTHRAKPLGAIRSLADPFIHLVSNRPFAGVDGK
jgi:hypothetical protein